ncbi:hypothetical protein BT69DRAFT_1343510 [Atractiella rhizophila]|nr:hypothetical protein BT69DRAFT_1343510 [Atractiella rhizophila]
MASSSTTEEQNAKDNDIEELGCRRSLTSRSLPVAFRRLISLSQPGPRLTFRLPCTLPPIDPPPSEASNYGPRSLRGATSRCEDELVGTKLDVLSAMSSYFVSLPTNRFRLLSHPQDRNSSVECTKEVGWRKRWRKHRKVVSSKGGLYDLSPSTTHRDAATVSNRSPSHDFRPLTLPVPLPLSLWIGHSVRQTGCGLDNEREAQTGCWDGTRTSTDQPPVLTAPSSDPFAPHLRCIALINL